MLEASKSEQKSLLEIGGLDLQLSKLQLELKASEAGAQEESTRKLILDSAEDLRNISDSLDRTNLEIEKISNDLSLVEARIAHDVRRKKEITNDRELMAIEHEFDSLNQRKSALETSELELLELKDSVSRQLEEISKRRAKLNLELEEQLSKSHAFSLELSAKAASLEKERDGKLANISDELKQVYLKKKARGILVASLDGRDCTSCRLAINGVNFDAIMSEPENRIPTCPNCDALIIR